MIKGQTKTELQTLRSQHSATLDELDKYKLLVDNVQDYAIFLMDDRGYIRTWNKGAEKNKGYKPHEIIGKHFSVFYMPEDVEAQKPEKELEIATQFGRAEDEDWRVRKDGSRFWASVVITALHNNDGQLVGFAKVTRDLTERKRYEDELRKANTLLKAQQQELKLLNQSKDEFISLASHQLRTPASAIKQLLGLFVEGFMPTIEARHLEIITKAYEANQRQLSIVDSLLKVAQVDSGKVILRLTECNLKELIISVIDDFREVIESRGQVLELSVDDPGLSVIADVQHMRMAFENLISNASKYTPQKGKITIMVQQARDEAVISISDTGVGISDDEQQNLFQKFRRIPNSLSNEVGGSGLGLYWAGKVVSLHNGRIEVVSVPDKGSTFTVYLPVEK